MRRQSGKSTGTETRFVHAYTTRQSEVLVRARPRQSEKDRNVESGDRNEPGRHGYETLAESQTGIPQEFDGEELRERDDVPSRVWKSMTNQTRIQTTVSTNDVDTDRQEITL